ALALAAGLIWAVVRFASENPEKAGLGDTVFRVGRAERLARTIADDGPFLVQDPLSAGRGRNVYVQHLGGDPDEGWLAVEARVPGDPGCAVSWDRGQESFADCRDTGYPADGAGLTTYPAEVTDGEVSVDLRPSR
ncbi:MAG: hypothetical protein ACRD03_09320, partial [Acidimicrobiales bacterium]